MKIQYILKKLSSKNVPTRQFVFNFCRHTYLKKSRGIDTVTNTYKNKWYGSDCKKARKVYNKARKLYDKSPSQYNKNMLNITSKQYKHTMNKYINKFNKSNEDKLRRLQSKQPKSYWKILNKFKNKNSNKSFPKLQELYTHFKNINNSDDSDNEHISENEMEIDDNSQNSLNAPFTNDEIRKCIHNLKSNKSPGIDGVINEYIKCTIDKMTNIYSKLFNIILDTGLVPTNWLQGIIIPIYKKGDHNDPNNYRPITLLSCVGKLFTSVLNNRLNMFLTENNIMNENQAGFRKDYSTIDHIFTLNSLIEILRHHKKKIFCAFIDFSKAFDSVWRFGMWQKLLNNNIKGNFFRVIYNMYGNIKSCVQIKHVTENSESPYEQSDFFECNIGVRQGENLSPILFSLFLNDVESYLSENNNNGIILNTFTNTMLPLLKLSLLLYADDTILIAEDKESLQKSLDDFERYCKHWKLNINVEKTKIMIFGSKSNNQHRFKIGNSNLEIVNTYKYLGIYFSRSCSFATAKKHLITQAEKALHFLYKKINNISLPVDLILKLFDHTIAPILTYSCEIWGYENVDIIEHLHNKFLRNLFSLRKGTPIYMLHGELGRFPLKIIIKSRMIGYWNRLMTGNQNKLSYLIYQHLLNMPNFESKWINYIKNIFIEVGRPDIWLEQNNLRTKTLNKQIKQILIDQYKQNWHESLQNSTKGITYSLFKHDMSLEKYFLTLPRKYFLPMIKFRLSNHYLPVETGRWNSTDISERKCSLCHLNDTGDEIHYLLTCPYFRQRRRQYIKNYYYKRPNVLKFSQLLNSTSKSELYDLSKFISVILSTLKTFY